MKCKHSISEENDRPGFREPIVVQGDPCDPLPSRELRRISESMHVPEDAMPFTININLSQESRLDENSSGGVML